MAVTPQYGQSKEDTCVAPVGRGSINYCCLHTSRHPVHCIQPYLNTLYLEYIALVCTTYQYTAVAMLL